MKKLPIGKQDFASLIEDGNLYVDKTEHIFRLIQSGTYIFLARPRRFGKSLLVSTLKEIFEGNRDLFRGLWIEDKIAWTPYPVIHVDFNVMNYLSNPLEVELDTRMEKIAQQCNVALTATNYKGKFQELLQKLSSNGKKVVVLIDEYDKAITDSLGYDDEEYIQENVRTLKNFYSTLTSLDQYIHFAFITGVSKYG
ncbi:MAG: AAA family ATPase, partial [Saprospiraceae bacterium]|nr:AAA family ATPase [Saprospiraceae bacterium]